MPHGTSYFESVFGANPAAPAKLDTPGTAMAQAMPFSNQSVFSGVQ
jgi:hypothetical protein